MTDAKEKYDPAIYGRLRASFLQRLDSVSPAKDVTLVLSDDEKRRQAIIRDIKEGKLVIMR
jgi:hypothetical protein